MKLAEFTAGRDNNFNLIRMAAAYAVLVTHSFALAIGRGAAEPLHGTLGMTLGTIAVDIFFLTSGFLVSASLLTRRSTMEFLWARVLRIFPALFVMLLVTVFGIGLFFTTLSGPSYLTDPKLYKYFLKNLTLIGGVAYRLPGVFETTPFPNAVNGSLWTMPYELWMYGILAAVWVLWWPAPKIRRKAFEVSIIAGAAWAGVYVVLAHFGVTEQRLFWRLFFMFFTGSAFFVLRGRIILSHSVFIACLAGLLLSAYHPRLFSIVYIATLAYILFYIAYIPSGLIRAYNRLGDYSYGVYIYAFPVQQSIAASVSGVSVLSMAIYSSIITLILAALSWHLLEKHALKRKGRFADHTRKLWEWARIRMGSCQLVGSFLKNGNKP